jgi:hypothetical protein
MATPSSLPASAGCASIGGLYIAGFLEMQTRLAHPFFCAGNLRVAEVEALIVEELRFVNKVAPELLDTHHMSIIVNATLERELPCETRLAQASKAWPGRMLGPSMDFARRRRSKRLLSGWMQSRRDGQQHAKT